MTIFKKGISTPEGFHLLAHGCSSELPWDGGSNKVYLGEVLST